MRLCRSKPEAPDRKCLPFPLPTASDRFGLVSLADTVLEHHCRTALVSDLGTRESRRNVRLKIADSPRTGRRGRLRAKSICKVKKKELSSSPCFWPSNFAQLKALFSPGKKVTIHFVALLPGKVIAPSSVLLANHIKVELVQVLELVSFLAAKVDQRSRFADGVISDRIITQMGIRRRRGRMDAAERFKSKERERDTLSAR